MPRARSLRFVSAADLSGVADASPSPADEVSAMLDGDAEDADVDARAAPLVERLLRVCPPLGLAFVEEFGFLRRARQYGVDLSRYKMPSVRELARRAGVHPEEARRAIAKASRPPGEGSVARSGTKGEIGRASCRERV